MAPRALRLIGHRPPTRRHRREVGSEARRTKFFSATYRLFKLPDLEPMCEDYGQAVVYRGGIAHAEDVFVLDKHHVIERGKVFPVCGNTSKMLAETRFAALRLHR